MKKLSLILAACVALYACKTKTSETATTETAEKLESKHLYLDVHNLEPGKVTFDAVADAHQKDLKTQGKYGVSFLKYWVDEAQGKVYCLAESPDSAAMVNAHKEAHGLVPDLVKEVTDGPEAKLASINPMFLDVHHLGVGKVNAAEVAKAHVKDLAVQSKYGVNFVNYWVDERLGVVMCLAESPDSAAMVNAHKEAHGLVPDEMHKVKEGH
jgi:hypothetical protein